MRSLRFKQANPSVDTLAICASKLQHYASCMTLKNSHNELSQRFTQLSNQCHQQINAQSQSVWVNQMTACFPRTAPSHYKWRCHARTAGPRPSATIRDIGQTSSPSGGQSWATSGNNGMSFSSDEAKERLCLPQVVLL